MNTSYELERIKGFCPGLNQGQKFEIGLPALIIMVFISQYLHRRKVHREVVTRTDHAGLLSVAPWLILFFEGKHGFQNVVEASAMMAASLVSLFEL
ncbi:hypothetical protein P8452_72828 [Trifolium repens]|nr:hypothetical protein P8452_72828 [Trifolium repens]